MNRIAFILVGWFAPYRFSAMLNHIVCEHDSALSAPQPVLDLPNIWGIKTVLTEA